MDTPTGPLQNRDPENMVRYRTRQGNSGAPHRPVSEPPIQLYHVGCGRRAREQTTVANVEPGRPLLDVPRPRCEAHHPDARRQVSGWYMEPRNIPRSRSHTSTAAAASHTRRGYRVCSIEQPVALRSATV